MASFFFGRLARPAVRAALLVLLTAAGSASCSVLADLNADQCQLDEDCARFEAELGSVTCREHVCVAVDASGGTPSNGGAPAEMTAGEAGQVGQAGDVGAPPVECQSNAECIDKNFGSAFLCLAGKCQDLVTPECPYVIGVENLRAPEPIVFGAYALAPDSAGRSTVARNLDLVISEFTDQVTGLRGGVDGTSRTLAFVVCNSYFPNVAPGSIDPFRPSLTHLIDVLHVPGIVSTLSARDLQAVFSQKLERSGTFVISAFEQDSELSLLADNGRLWHMLGAASDLAPTFGPLLKRTEAFLRRDESYLKLPSPGAPLRVAVVSAQIAREQDVADALLKLPETTDFDVETFQVESALLNENPDVSTVSEQLLKYAPHVIVALAGSEFVEGVIPALESGTTWLARTAGQQRPFYLLGAAMASETWLAHSPRVADSGGWSTLFERAVGVAYASTTDETMLRAYEHRLLGANGDTDPALLLGLESVYDAGYLMVYAAAAAGDQEPLLGKDLGSGMRRLVEGEVYDVGPGSISEVLTALALGEDLGLNLTLGPADWDVARGTRKGLGSVYCFNNGASPAETKAVVQGPTPDALRYDLSSNALEEKPLLCIPDF